MSDLTNLLNTFTHDAPWVCTTHRVDPALPLHRIFVESCVDNNNACVIDCCRRMTRLGVVFHAHSPFPKMFVPLVNNTSAECCISTNLFQQNMNDGNCIASQSFDLDVCTLFRLRNMSRGIFCLIFGQFWHCEISAKQSQKLPYSLRISSDYTVTANKTWFQSLFFHSCTQSSTSDYW